MNGKKDYSVCQISQLLGVNRETVRRWLRGGLLKASYSSCKGGYLVKSSELQTFLSLHQKYNKEVSVEPKSSKPKTLYLDSLLTTCSDLIVQATLDGASEQELKALITISKAIIDEKR